MARRKKPENETAEDASTRQLLESVSDHATRSEKVSWERKQNNMAALLEQLKPIEDQIIDLMAKKMPIIDQISELRKEMVKQCIHPYSLLVRLDENTARCKFCERTITHVSQPTDN